MNISVRNFLGYSYNHGYITIMNNKVLNEILWEGKFETMDNYMPDGIAKSSVVKQLITYLRAKYLCLHSSSMQEQLRVLLFKSSSTFSSFTIITILFSLRVSIVIAMSDGIVLILNLKCDKRD